MSESPNSEWEDEYSAPKRSLVPYVGRIGLFGLVIIATAIVLYYLVGVLLVHRISDDIAFKPAKVPSGGSHAVAAAAALIERETDINRWTANDPFFLPASLLDNMPNFQKGVIYALSRFAIEMADQIGRTRGSSEVDKDLDTAAGLLKYPGDVWIFDPSTSLAPTAPSESQYRKARRMLLAYNDRLAGGDAVFDTRTDNLQATLERMTADLGSSSAIIDQHLAADHPSIFNTKVDDIFYNIKGRLYGYDILLRELRIDFETVIADRKLGKAWSQMLATLDAAASLDPLLVVNGSPDGLYFPSHLAVQGFYLLRGRTQLREIINILQK